MMLSMYCKETYHILFENLKYLRLKFGFTQEHIAHSIHCDAETYSHYETGKETPNIQILQSLSDMYHISTEQLICENLSQESELLSANIDQKICIYLKRFNHQEKEKVLKYLQRIETERK